MTTSLAVLYATFFAGVAVLLAAWAWGDLPDHGPRFYGRSPIIPDLRNVLVVEEAPDVRHTPSTPLGRHA